MPELVAGVDCSTQATKVLVMDPDDGRLVAEGRAPHLVTGTGGARETHLDVWWEALAGALAATGRAGDVGAIAVAGQQHGMVVLDGGGMALRPATLWNDTRAAPDAAALIDARGAGWWAEEIGVVPVASFTAAKWAWLRRTEPEVANAARAVRLPHDYLTERLCGRGVTDRGDASGTAWWSTATEQYSPDVLDLIGLDRALLPEVLGPAEAAGVVAGGTLGLPAGCLVAPGTGDNMGAALGLGLEPGTPVVSLGTSGTAYAVSGTRTVDPSGAVAGFAHAAGAYLPLTATLNCTLAVDRVAGWLGLDREAVAADTAVVVLPYLDGERSPNLPDSAGLVTGLRHATEPGEILLAAYRGAAASLLEAVEAIDALSSGLDPDAPLVLIGGGARGSAWRRVVGELSGRELQIPAVTELVAIGAAAQAAAMLHAESSYAIAQRWGTRSGVTVPARPRNETALERIVRSRTAAGSLLSG